MAPNTRNTKRRKTVTPDGRERKERTRKPSVSSEEPSASTAKHVAFQPPLVVEENPLAMVLYKNPNEIVEEHPREAGFKEINDEEEIVVEGELSGGAEQREGEEGGERDGDVGGGAEPAEEEDVPEVAGGVDGDVGGGAEPAEAEEVPAVAVGVDGDVGGGAEPAEEEVPAVAVEVDGDVGGGAEPAEKEEVPAVAAGVNGGESSGVARRGAKTRDSETEHSGGDYTAMPPVAMHFHPEQYYKKIKISTRCFVAKTLAVLKSLNLDQREENWFKSHPQFRHIFHMPEDKNHKVQGMWMLLLRTACTETKKEVWFVVNGVPIRYSIEEHGLISGLNCRNYPLGWMEMGSTRFVDKHFGKGATIRFQDVEAKVHEMEPCVDRLKMLVLYFLCSIIGGQTKVGNDAPSVDPFFLRVVDDLSLCCTFPWGRLSFDHMMRELGHTMDHFEGEVKENIVWSVPGFCIPLELLPFEAIPILGNKFREPAVGADTSCPRMCKSNFKKGVMKGFPLSAIYEALGDTTVIESILVPQEGEEDLLHGILEPEDDVDRHDAVVESWKKSVQAGHAICFENMLAEDLAGRVRPASVDVPNPQQPKVKGKKRARESDLEERLVEQELLIENLLERVEILESRASKGGKGKGKGKKGARE